MRLYAFTFRLLLCVGLLSVPFGLDVAMADSGGWLAAHEMAVRPAVLGGANGGSLGSRNWFLYQSKAGARIDDTLEFWNKGKKEVKIVVEAADAELLDSGFALIQPGVTGKYIGKWVSFVRDGGVRGGPGLVDQTDKATIVTVGAGQKRQFPFSIMVPLDAHEGDYWGGITVREILLGESKRPANAVWRVGVRVLVRVGRSDAGGATVRLPQVGFGGVYYPELSLFLRNFAERIQMPPVFQALFALFYRG